MIPDHIQKSSQILCHFSTSYPFLLSLLNTTKPTPHLLQHALYTTAGCESCHKKSGITAIRDLSQFLPYPAFKHATLLHTYEVHNPVSQITNIVKPMAAPILQIVFKHQDIYNIPLPFVTLLFGSA